MNWDCMLLPNVKHHFIDYLSTSAHFKTKYFHLVQTTGFRPLLWKPNLSLFHLLLPLSLFHLLPPSLLPSLCPSLSNFLLCFWSVSALFFLTNWVNFHLLYVWLRPKWLPIPLIVHYRWPGPIRPILHYRPIVNRVLFGIQTMFYWAGRPMRREVSWVGGERETIKHWYMRPQKDRERERRQDGLLRHRWKAANVM